MQGETKKQLRNAGLFAGASPSPVPGPGMPYKYAGKQHEYFESPTTAFIFQNAQYAANYYAAEVQGIMPGSFDTVRKAYIRSMDIVEQTTGTKMPNDFQSIYFQDTRIRGLYTGAKVKFGGNTWLAISPFNVSDPLSSAVIRRCNAIWKHLDYYGNILAEPFVFYDARAQATASDYSDYGVIPRWYQKCVMQLNDQTKELAYNRRIILGSSAIEVRGLVDFITDFSGQNNEESGTPEPSHVMFFDAQYQEPDLALDDMENGIAGAKAFSWVIAPSFASTMGANDTQTIHVISRRNGEEVVPTTEHPISYVFSTSDSDVLAVDGNGNVQSVGERTATVTITLLQNRNIKATAEITVTNAIPQAEFVFPHELPAKLKQMQTYTGSVRVKRGGNVIAETISMIAYGATEAAEATLGNVTLTIRAYEASDIPLSLVFQEPMNNITYTANIQLGGF